MSVVEAVWEPREVANGAATNGEVKGGESETEVVEECTE